MIKKTIKFGLSESEIDRAIKEIDEYKKYTLSKTELLKKRIAEFIADKAGAGFSGSIVDDLLPESGGPRYANVNVTIKEDGGVFIVIANGEDAVWVEFGAGVYHNGPPGSTPNPLGEQLGFRIGEYGLGYGKGETWYFEDHTTGETKFTHGTPANMPMYKALEAVVHDLKSIVREVFKEND